MPSSLRRHRYWLSDCSFAVTVPSCQRSCTLRLGVEPSARQTRPSTAATSVNSGILGGMCCSRVLQRAWRPPAAIRTPKPLRQNRPHFKNGPPRPQIGRSPPPSPRATSSHGRASSPLIQHPQGHGFAVAGPKLGRGQPLHRYSHQWHSVRLGAASQTV